MLNRDTRIPATAVLGTIILERIFDVLVLLVLLVVAALASGWESPWTGPLAALGVAAGVLFIIAAAATSGAIKLPSPAASALKRLLRRPFGGALLRISTSLGAGSARLVGPLDGHHPGPVRGLVADGSHRLFPRAEGVRHPRRWLLARHRRNLRI